MKNLALAFACIFIFLSGCAYVEPLVSQFNIISVPQEVEMGKQLSAEVAKQMPVVGNTADADRVRRIGARLVQALPRRDFPYAFHVVEERSPNAFTIPGGSIYVHTGLIQFVEDDDELAGVMAHELGHAYDRHPANSLSRAYGAEYLSNLIFGKNQTKMSGIALQFARGSLLLRYGREDELRADEIGHSLLSRAGFRTDGLLRFFRKLQTIEGRGTPIPFLSTHPPTAERIARLEALERSRPAMAPPRAAA